MTELSISPLDAESFRPFGDVIETAGHDWFPINNGLTQRFHDLAELQAEGTDARLIMSIFRAQPLDLPLKISMLERHPHGSQAFMPLNRECFLVVVAPVAETPGIDDVRAFITDGSQGVNYHKGVWHHPVIAIDRETDFLIIDRSGEEANCDEHFFSETNPLTLPSPKYWRVRKN